MAARTVLQQADITRALTRISHEILESDRRRRRSRPPRHPHARRRCSRSASARSSTGSSPAPASVGALDVTMYRDDLARQPTRTPSPTSVPGGRHRRQDRRARRRRAVLGPHHPRRARRAERPRPARGRAAGGARRPRPPRAADPRRLRRQEPAQRRRRAHQREARRDRRRGPGRTIAGAPRNEAPALGTRPRPRDGHRHPGSRRGHGGRRHPRGPEAADPARAHRREPVLRGLDPHAAELRGRGEAPRRRRHHLQREGLERLEGREPQGHRADARGDGGGCGRPPARRRPVPRGCSPTADGSTPPSSTPATARTSTRRRRCSTPSRCASACTARRRADATSTGCA